MAIYHCSIKIISRGKGKSAVAAAAYRSGENLTNEYDGITHDYTRKGGVVHTEILLPDNAPAEYADRAVLWNAVEKIEKAKNAQLAREIEIALPKELTREQGISLVREYVKEQFVNAGMCADIAIHDKEDGNPHAHVMLTIRPIEQDGTWGAKQKKEYVLDRDGNKIYDPKKRSYKCKSIPATDWNDQTKAEEWRSAWAEICNRALEQNGHTERIDHRSYARQGIDRIPTVHLGIAAFQMEKRGIITKFLVNHCNTDEFLEEETSLFEDIKGQLREMEQHHNDAKAIAERQLSDMNMTGLTITCPACGEKFLIRDDKATCVFCGYTASGTEAAQDYVENVLGIDSFSTIKDGGEIPVYECPQCGNDALVFNNDTGEVLCFSCDYEGKTEDFSFCDWCGKPYECDGDDEIGMCPDCIAYRMEKDD